MAKILTLAGNLSYAEWLGFRRKGIGGSDASIVCGVNRYRSSVELWLDKTNQIPLSEAGEAAYWGTMLEPFVRNEFTRRTGHNVRLINEILYSEDHPFMLANLDGIVEHPEYGDCIFEAKTASAFKAGEWDGDNIPIEYLIQVQHYMHVTGYSYAFIAVLIGGNDYRWKVIKRDDNLISALIKLEADFWNHVQRCIPPEIDGSEATSKYLSKKYSGGNSAMVALPDDAIKLVAEYSEAHEQIKAFSEKKQLAENKLKDMLGDNELGAVGSTCVIWKSVSQERLNTKKLKAEQPDIYNRYSVASTFRKFSIKGQEE